MEATTDRQARMRQAIALYGRKQFDEAEAIFRELQPHRDTRGDASYGLGLIALERGAADEAYGWLCMVSHGSPRYADSRFYMAQIERDRGNVGACARLCGEALKIEPSHARARSLGAELQQQHARLTAPAAPAAPQSAGAKRTETDMWLPGKDEIEDYAARRVAKERADWWITNWKGLPAGVKVFNIVAGALFLGFFTYMMYMFLWYQQGASGRGGSPMGASEAWCSKTYAMWKKNPGFYGESTLIELREANCQRWGIPPEGEVERIRPRSGPVTSGGLSADAARVDGRWKREDTGDVIRIVRDGDSVTAIMDNPSSGAAARGRRSGDLAFEGTFDAGTIRGTAYLLFSAEEVGRCPGFASDQPRELELTLSSDGNTLQGSRVNYQLSDDCHLGELPRQGLTYVRISG